MSIIGIITGTFEFLDNSDMETVSDSCSIKNDNDFTQ